MAYSAEISNPIISSLSDKLSRNTSLLVGSATLGLFLNTWTVDDKYSRLEMENFPQPVQIQLSK